FGWAPHGGCAHQRDFFVCGCRYSILPAILLDGVLHLEVLDHPFTGDAFLDFVEGTLGQMQLWPLPNTVLVVNNAIIHKVPSIRELVWSAVKAWLRNNCDYILGETEGPMCDPYALIWEAVHSTITPEKVYGWFRHSKYIA
ncbi:hypothetical protein SERLADRAFT_346442, partial [Serpula lacrymans var. lacrymans S7.9]